MNTKTNLEIGRSLLDAINAGDLSGWEAALAEDFTFSYPGFREGGDREAAKAYNAGILAGVPDLHFDIQRTIAQGNTIVYQYMASGSHTAPLALPTGTVPPTGRKGNLPGVLISIVEAGKIVREESYWNQLELLIQLGLMDG
jgi:predicted ester cyclase